MPAHPIVSYARAAFATGWAASGGPMTEKVQAGCLAAIQFAIDHSDDPNVLEATLHLGHLEGVWASIFDRRTRLYADNVAKVMDAWRSLVSSLVLAQTVTTVRRQAGLAEATSNNTTAAFAATLVLNQLFSSMAQPAWAQLRQAVRDAISSGLAEGQAGAMALLADQISQTGFDFDRAFADARAQVGTDSPFLASVDTWLGNLMDDVAESVGAAIAQSIDDGEEFDDTVDAADEALNSPVGPMTFSVDQFTHLAITAGILWFYRLNGAVNIWFITAGDEKVCPQCDDAEANSPYEIADVPAPPLHPNCRCSLYTDDTLSADLVDPYLI